MNPKPIKRDYHKNRGRAGDSIGHFMLERAYSVIIVAAMLCTMITKFYHALRYQLVGEYYSWILADVAFFLVVEAFLALICYRWPRKWVVRAAVIFAAVLCTWSVLNAGWLIRTGTQILPRVLLSLIRSPSNALYMIGVNLVKMPKAAVILLGPSAVALVFFFYVLAQTRLPAYNRKLLIKRITLCLAIVLAAVIARPFAVRKQSLNAVSAGLRFNSQIKAVMSLAVRDYSPAPNPGRRIPFHDQVKVELTGRQTRQNVVIVVLEGVQYQYTSLAGDSNNLTPFLKKLASQGVEFANTRSFLTHTTKALFAILTGRYSSASQDLAETVPVDKHYASITTILGDVLGYRTAFFQSARGDFESRPGLVCNLGFDKFWSRDDLGDPNNYIGYLGCDEFAMLPSITQWIQEDNQPFLLTVLCSVTHDPYEVPEWFGVPAKEKFDSYRQTISYTDSFLAALDVELSNLNLADETIFCVIGDHGEAFGEHGQLGHNRIAFDEVLRVPFCLRAPFFVKPATKVDGPVSSIDLTPTLLSLLGFDINGAGFDGINVLQPIAGDRRIYFSGWMQEGPLGYVQNNRKYIYDPIQKTTIFYDLGKDPEEKDRMDVTEEQALNISNDIISWRNKTIFEIDQTQNGRKILFGEWLCRWANRVSTSKYLPPTKERQ